MCEESGPQKRGLALPDWGRGWQAVQSGLRVVKVGSTGNPSPEQVEQPRRAKAKRLAQLQWNRWPEAQGRARAFYAVLRTNVA